MGIRSDGIFTEDEHQRIHSYAQGLGGTIHAYELAAEDPEFNKSLHRVWRCAWWNKYRGMVVAVEGLNPQERLK